MLDVPSGGGTAYVGTIRPVRREEWAELVDDQAVDTMLELLRPLRIDVGDGVVVPASTPHCLDAGVFVVELQEPTDFSILLEWDGFKVDGLADGHLGLGFPTALGAVRTDALSTADVDELVRRAALRGRWHPRPVATGGRSVLSGVGRRPRARRPSQGAGGVLGCRRHRRQRHPALGRRQVDGCQGRRARRAARRRPTDIRRRRSRRHGRRRPTTVAGCPRTGREGRAVSRELLIGIDVGTTRGEGRDRRPHRRRSSGGGGRTPWVVDGQAVEMDARARRCRAHGHRRRSPSAPRPAWTGNAAMTASSALGSPASPSPGCSSIDRRAGGADHRLARPTRRRRAGRQGAPRPRRPHGRPLRSTRHDLQAPRRLRHGDGVRWLNVAEWVVHSLGGAQQAEISLSGRTGLCDLHTATWWPDALEFLGVDESFLPGDPVFGVSGAGQASFGPIAGARLVVAGHDHQVAAFVAGAVEPGCLFESLGTADAIALTVPARRLTRRRSWPLRTSEQRSGEPSSPTA